MGYYIMPIQLVASICSFNAILSILDNGAIKVITFKIKLNLIKKMRLTRLITPSDFHFIIFSTHPIILNSSAHLFTSSFLNMVIKIIKLIFKKLSQLVNFSR